MIPLNRPTGADPDHEHPPWTATSRGVETSLRRLAMLEPVYRLAPDLIRSGRVNRPADDAVASREVRMTDFRLLRRGGFYHAVARYGPDLWTPFTYAGLHATERSLRRQGAAPLLGRGLLLPRGGPVSPHRQPAVLRIPGPGGGTLGPDSGGRRRLGQGAGPQHPVQFHAHAVLHPRRTVQRGRGTASLSDRCTTPRASTVGRPEQVGLWLRENPDMEAIDGRMAHRLFITICQFPAMRASWLREVVGGSSGEISRHLGRFVQTGLVAVFDGRHYLSELGMRRAANMSRVLPSVIRSRHGAYLDRWYREHEEHHNDGVNQLVVRFAREGVEVVAGWRGEVNVPGLTQVRPDLLVQVSGGALGAGVHCIEFERTAVSASGSGVQAGALPPDGGGGAAPAPAHGVRNDAGPAELPGRSRGAAHADHHPGTGLRRAGDRARSRCGAGTGFRRRCTAGRERCEALPPRRFAVTETPPFGIPLPPQPVPGERSAEVRAVRGSALSRTVLR